MLTIGVFDGVHLGHRHLLNELKSEAKQRDMLSGVVTFRQHPQDYFSPRKKLPFITDLGERIRLLEEEGIDFVAALSFTDDLAGLGARDFLRMLQKHLRMKGLVVGPDFALGKNREGNIEVLPSLGEEMGFSVKVAPPLEVNGVIASSTAIRRALAKGDTGKVYELSSRYFRLHGRVMSGAGRGGGLGFPTANLEINQEQALPADGVYATWVHFDGETCKSLTNVGTDPTFGANKRTVEVYIVDYSDDLYGRELKVDFVERLRGEVKFSSIDELIKQMAEDVRQGGTILSTASSR